MVKTDVFQTCKNGRALRSMTLLPFVGSFEKYNYKLAGLYAAQVEAFRIEAQIKAPQITTDHRTGLYNSRYFEISRKRELERIGRYGGSLAIILLDIDNFKKFNDAHGHGFGDKVLARVAKIIIKEVRQNVDIPARYGGDELAIILPNTDSKGAREVAERIRKAVEAQPITHKTASANVTVSCGVYATSEKIDPYLFTERADKALYESKCTGRNSVREFVPKE